MQLDTAKTAGVITIGAVVTLAVLRKGFAGLSVSVGK